MHNTSNTIKLTLFCSRFENSHGAEAGQAATKNTDLNKPRHSNVQFKRPTGDYRTGPRVKFYRYFLSPAGTTAGKRTFCLFSSPCWINPSVDEEQGRKERTKNDRKGKAEGRGGERWVVRIVRERVANISWREPLALPTDEGAAGFVALIYAKTGAVYYRYCWMCACVKLETQTSVHANLTRPSASARYSPRPSDKEGTLLSSPFAPFSPTLAPETNLRHPINRLPCSFL